MTNHVDIIQYEFVEDSSLEFAQDLFEIAEESFEYGSPWTVKQFQGILERNNIVLFAAYQEDKIVGFLCGVCTPFEAEIYNIVTSKLNQGMGIGTNLIHHLIDLMSQRDVSDLWLEVRENNLEAISFYKNVGFELIGLRKNYYKNPKENALILKYTNV